MRRAAVLALLIAALAGCGGDDDGSNGGNGGDALSAEEYREQANTICAETQEEIDAVELEEGDVEGYFEQVLPIARERRDELADLEPPAELSEGHDELVAATDEVIGTAEDLAEAAADDDAEEIQDATARGAEQQNTLDTAARELGVDDCASG